MRASALRQRACSRNTTCQASATARAAAVTARCFCCGVKDGMRGSSGNASAAPTAAAERTSCVVVAAAPQRRAAAAGGRWWCFVLVGGDARRLPPSARGASLIGASGTRGRKGAGQISACRVSDLRLRHLPTAPTPLHACPRCSKCAQRRRPSLLPSVKSGNACRDSIPVSAIGGWRVRPSERNNCSTPNRPHSLSSDKPPRAHIGQDRTISLCRTLSSQAPSRPPP